MALGGGERKATLRLAMSEAEKSEWEALKAEVWAVRQAAWKTEKAEQLVEEAKESEDVNLEVEEEEVATIPYSDIAPDTVEEEAEEVEEEAAPGWGKKTGKKRKRTCVGGGRRVQPAHGIPAHVQRAVL